MKKIKQIVSCEKNINVSIITASIMLTQKENNVEKVTEWLQTRLKELRRKYGFAIFYLVLEEILRRKEYKKQVNIKGKKVNLFYEPAINYYQNRP